MIISKKTGNIITAFVIGLAVLWFSQKTIFAQEPITDIYAENAIFYCATASFPHNFSLSTIYTDTYATGEPDGDYAGWESHDYNDVACPSGEMNAILDFGAIYTATSVSVLGGGTVSVMGQTTTICTDEECWDDITTAGIWTNFGGGWYAGGDLAWQTVSLTSTEIVSTPVRYVRLNMGSQTGDGAGKDLYVDAVRIHLAEPIYPEPEPIPTCTTVIDAHFDSPEVYGDDGWTLDMDNVTIHNSYLDITTQYMGGYAYQPFTPTKRIYTATIYARSATSETTTAKIGMVSNLADGDFITFPIEETSSDDFTKYTFPISNTLSPGNKAYLYIEAGEGGLQVDYFCVEAEAGACANPIETEYVYAADPNSSENNLNEWVPFQLDESLDVAQLTARIPIIPGTTPDPAGGYKQSFTSDWTIFNILRTFLNIFNLSADAVTILEDNVYSGEKVSSIALKMPGRGSLQSISVDIIPAYAVLGVNMTVLALVNDEWIDVGYTGKRYTDSPLNPEADTLTIYLRPVDSPTQYIIVSTISGSGLNPFTNMLITKIAPYGCFSGMAYSSACIVSDPDLDTGENGGPDDYYWYWSPTAPVISGSVTLADSNQSELSQNVFAEAPGQYQLSINMDSATADGCELLATGMNPDRTARFFSVSMPCKSGIVSQTVTAQVTLPAEPFKFILTSEQGVNVINSVCFGAPSDGCINLNYDFTDGLANYSGGEVVAGGGVLLSPGQALQAIGVPYTSFQEFRGPFILTVNADIFTNTNVSGGSVNTYILPPSAVASTPGISDTFYTVSGATEMSYTIATHPQSDWGPSVWNWDNASGESLRITGYCITTGTNGLWYGNKSCTTVTNPDFNEGLNGWTNSGVYDAGSWVKFSSGGYVSQTVNPLNLITNPSFEVNTTGWYEVDTGGYLTVTRDTAEYKTGSASAKFVKSVSPSATSRYYTQASSAGNTAYTFGAWVKTTGKFMVFVRQSDGSSYTYSAVQTGTGDWAFYSVTGPAKAGTSAVLGGIAFSTSTPGTEDVYMDGAVLVAGSSIPVQYTTPQSTTLHWIGKAPDNLPTSATATISSTAGIYTVTHQFSASYIPDVYFDKFEVGGDVEIKITSDPLFELDYVCLLGGSYDGEGDDGEGPGGGVPDDIGEWSEVCGAPPVLIITNTISSWVPSIWPELTAPDNLTTLTAYTAMNVRYIACFITGWAQLGLYKTDQIIVLLRQIKDQLLIGNLLTLLGIVVLIVSTMFGATGEILDTIAALAPLLDNVGSLAGLIMLIPALVALVVLIIMLVRVLIAIGPVFFATFNAALLGTEGVTLIPDSGDQQVLGYIIAGMQIFDKAAGQTYLMPFVVIVIAIGSIGLLIWTINKISNWTT